MSVRQGLLRFLCTRRLSLGTVSRCWLIEINLDLLFRDRILGQSSMMVSYDLTDDFSWFLRCAWLFFNLRNIVRGQQLFPFVHITFGVLGDERNPSVLRFFSYYLMTGNRARGHWSTRNKQWHVGKYLALADDDDQRKNRDGEETKRKRRLTTESKDQLTNRYS